MVGFRCGKTFGVATLRAVVHAGDKTSEDARSWYMIGEDAKSWVCCNKGKWTVLEIKDMHPWGFGIRDLGESSESGSEKEGSEDKGPDFEEEEEATPKGQQQHTVQVVDTTMDEPLGLGYRAARRRSLELTELGAQVEFQGGLIYDHAQRLDALPPALFEGHDRDLRELYTRSRVVRDEIFSQRYRLRSLEQE
ncbi:hypothetical protein Tco_1540695 [Tanacetum coccineum]